MILYCGPVRKKSGDIHLCVDYRSLNKASVRYNFPLPNMDQILQQVMGSQMMSLSDGFSSYNQIHVKKVEKYKTTFTTRWGTFTYGQMPFGLINASATFQRTMQLAFNDLIKKIIQIYPNDITVYSRCRKYHFKHVRRVLIRCRRFGISLNTKKSVFGVTRSKLLGHIVSEARISIDPKRVEEIKNLLPPNLKKEVQSFMGRVNFVLIND